MIGGLIAANSSTVLTHLNWGASYLVHDFYRRFINETGTEHHYVSVGRLMTVVLFICAGLLTFILDTASDAFHLILLVGAGTGLLYLVRWFWWRVNAWSEVAAMISSFVISVGFKTLDHLRVGPDWIHDGTNQFLLTIVVTTVCWVATAYLAPGTDDETLIRFYLKVRPAGPGWAAVRRQAELVTHVPRGQPRQYPSRATRLVDRLHRDLVRTVHRRQLSIRPMGLHPRDGNHLHHQRQRPYRGRAASVGCLGGIQ